MFRPDFAVAKYFSALHMANGSFTVKVFFFSQRIPQIMLHSAKACAPGITVSEQIFLAKCSVCFRPELSTETENEGDMVGAKDKLFKGELTLQAV